MKVNTIILTTSLMLFLLAVPAAASADDWYLTGENGIHPESAWNYAQYPDGKGNFTVSILRTAEQGSLCANLVRETINNVPYIKLTDSVVGSGGTIYTTNVISAINTETLNGTNVILMPFKVDDTSAGLTLAVQMASDADVLCVCAAGDDERDIDANPYYPASYPYANILSVAASDKDGKVAAGSNYGTSNVTISAPGNTTIEAASVTTGAAALIKSINRALTAPEIRTLITANSDSLTTGSKAGGFGRLNLSKSADAAALTVLEPTRLNLTADKPLLNATGNETAVLSTAAYNRFGTLVSSNVTYTAAPDNAAEITGNIFTPKRAYADNRTEVNVTITAAAKTNISAVSSINLTILPLYPAEVTFTKQTTTLNPGQTFTFAAAVHDQTGEELNMSLNWTSSKPAIGTINATSGLFAALTPGKTTVSASVKNNTNITGSIDVTVLAKAAVTTPQNQNDHYSVKSSDTWSTHSSSSSSGSTSHTSGARQTPTPAETQQETQEPKPVVTETREAIPVMTLSPSGKPVETPLSCVAVVLGILAAAIARRKM